MTHLDEPAIRPATEEDLSAIVAMLADDPLGATRESPDDLTPYLAAFRRLADDPHQHVVVAVREGRVVGTLQLTIVPGLSAREPRARSSKGYASTPTNAEAAWGHGSSNGPSRSPAVRTADSCSSPRT